MILETKNSSTDNELIKDAAQQTGPLAWFARNHVAANLIMVFLLASGAAALFTIKMEVFPEIDTGMITISVPYERASLLITSNLPFSEWDPRSSSANG